MILLIILIILTVGSSIAIAISVINDYEDATVGWSITLGIILLVGWGLLGSTVNVKEQTFTIPANEIKITRLDTHVAVEYNKNVVTFDDTYTYKLVSDSSITPIFKVTTQSNLYNFVNERKYFLTK